MMAAAASSMIDITIFNPLVTTKESVEQFLKQTFDGKNDFTNVRYIHPFSKNRQCCYDTTTKTLSWMTLDKPIEPASLLAQNFNLATTEDRVLNKILQHDNLQYLYLNDKKIKIQPIPDNQEVIECSTDINNLTPLIFIISKVYNGNYFDLVIHEYNSIVDDMHGPLYYSRKEYKKKKASERFPFMHSGDKGLKPTLIQYLTIRQHDDCLIDDKNNSGIISTHAYNRKSFLDIVDCDPSICIVDYSNDNVKIYIKHFPLSRDFVQNSSICHIAKFTYIPEEKKVIWIIPQQPEFDSALINVGVSYKKYDDGIQRFKEKIKMINLNLNDISVTTTTVISDVDDDDDDDDDEKYNTLIIQKPLLKDKKFEKLFNDILNNKNIVNKKNTYTFHTNISLINDDDDFDNIVDTDYKYTLPIAGGSVISNGSIIKLGRYIKQQQTARKFKKVLNNNNNNNRPIVILCDKSSSVNIPKVESKLNAVYILINLDEDMIKTTTIEERLNNINASLAISMQGCLSTIFVYFPSNHSFYYYRGIINDHNNIKKKISFGYNIKLDDILSEASSFLASSLVIPSSSSVWSIYDIGGQKELFTINNNEDDINNILKKIIESLGVITNIDDIFCYLKYILAQIEVNLRSQELEDMISIVAEKVNNTKQLTRKQCLKLIIQNKQNISMCPTQGQINNFMTISKEEDMNRYYSRLWLVETMGKILNIDDKHTLLSHYTNMFRDIGKIINNFKSNIYEKSLFDVLNTCVSMRSCYGYRKKGLNQIIRQKKVKTNLEFISKMDDEAMDDLMEKNCTDDGVIILKINMNNLLSLEEEGAINNKEIENKIKSLTTRLPRFDRMSKQNAPWLLQEYDRLNFTWNHQTFLIIPILKSIVDVMKEPQKHNWREVKEGGPIELVRMMLRKSIYELIPENRRKIYDIKDAGSEKITNILINVLISSIYTMADNRVDFSKCDESDGRILQFRCLMGYILSIMASGVNKPASLVYQTILHENVVTNSKINLGNDNENMWLHQLLNVWSYLNLNNIDVHTNTKNCIYNRLKDCCNTIMYNKNDDNDNYDPKKEKWLQKEREVHKKALWTYDVLRPVVVNILKRKIPDIVKEEEKIEKEYRKRVDNDDEQPPPPKRKRKERITKEQQIAQQTEIRLERNKIRHHSRLKKFYFDDDDDDDDEILEQQKKEYTENKIREILQTNPAKTKSRIKVQGNFYYDDDFLEEMKFTLHIYKQLTGNYSKKMNNKSYLFRILDKIDTNIIKYTSDTKNNLSPLINDLYSTALDIYLNKSTIFLQLVLKLHNHISLSKSIDDIDILKYSILCKVLKFKTPLYTYTRLPHFVKYLLNCKTIEHYKSNNFKVILDDFINSSLMKGHFMKGFIPKENVLVDPLEEERRLKDKQIEKLVIEINKDVKLIRMFNYLNENKYMRTKDEILNNLVKTDCM